MITVIRELWQVLTRNIKALVIFAGGIVIILLLAGFFVSYRLSQPTFCNSCHYMAPYVRHWEASGHADVTCIKCHDYGLGDFTLAAVRYVTKTYTMRPKASVRNESCLAEGCHDVASLQEPVRYRKNIYFDHTVHLEKPLRGEKLRCTSCHNQIVQYDESVSAGHMEVNDEACFVCHFKDAGEGQAITGCDACHGMPKEPVTHAGFTFDHGPYLKLKVECKQCHTRIVKGDGSVPEGRCFSCHVERSRQQYSREQLHAIHVTGQGIDCFKCHTDIRHGNFEMASALDIRCEDCHLRQHNRPKQLYMGIGGKDTLDMPSAMFTAQVSCVGCHTHLTPEGEPMSRQAKKEAQRAACVMCHGGNYDLVFDNWLSGSRTVIKEYSGWLRQVKADLQTIGGSRKKRTAARQALGSAEYNYNFVREGHIPHNIQYSLYLLNSSAKKVAAAMHAIKSSYTAPSPGESLKPENSCVTFCHGNRPPAEYVNYEGRELPHQMHIEELELSCASCHSVTEHGKVNIDQSVCADCHDTE